MDTNGVKRDGIPGPSGRRGVQTQQGQWLEAMDRQVDVCEEMDLGQEEVIGWMVGDMRMSTWPLWIKVAHHMDEGGKGYTGSQSIKGYAWRILVLAGKWGGGGVVWGC